MLLKLVMGHLKNFTDLQPVASQTVTPQEPPVNKEKQLTDIPGTTENLEAHLAAIDEKLRNPELSDDDINRLLDERTSIMEELGTKH